MALDLRTSQNLPLTSAEDTPLHWVGRRTTHGSFWPVHPLTKDLFLENPFPDRWPDLTLCSVGRCCWVEYGTKGFSNLVEEERANFN